jgi:predicted transcriptional regulator of viral defense system
MKVEGFFARHPVFTWDEFLAFHAGRGTEGQRSAEALLAYHTRAGHLLRGRRGLYVVVPVGMSPDATPVDPYLLATRSADDAVLAYHTALEAQGAAYSTHERVVFTTTLASRPWSFRSLQFRPVRVPRALRDKGAPDAQVTKIDLAGLDVRVTTLERTLVDVLDRPDLGGGWEEVWRSLEAVSFFDLDSVAEYALLLGNSTTTAKVGFFLEQHRDALAVEEHHLQRLRAHRPHQPHYADRRDGGENVFLRDWNLVVPVALVERTWGEVG